MRVIYISSLCRCGSAGFGLFLVFSELEVVCLDSGPCNGVIGHIGRWRSIGMVFFLILIMDNLDGSLVGMAVQIIAMHGTTYVGISPSMFHYPK